MNKVYQIHRRYEVDGRVLHAIQYGVYDGISIDDSDEDTETYSLEVSDQTLRDEIRHCKSLIYFWKQKPDYQKVDLIIERQQNLIKYYENLLLQLELP